MNNFIEIFNKGLDFHKKNKFENALEIYLELLSNDKSNVNLLYLIGTCYIQTKKPELAINYLEKTIELDNKHIAAYNNLGGAYFEIKRIDDSIKIYKQLFKLNPNYKLAKNNIANCYFEQKKYDEALKIYQSLIKEDPNNYVVYNNIGNVYNNLNNIKLAIFNYNKSIKINNNYVLAYKNLGEIFFKAGDYKKALEIFQKTNEIVSDFKDILSRILHTKMKICDWKDYENFKYKIFESSENGNIHDPFIFLSIIDNPILQKKIAENFVKKNFFNNNQLIFQKKKYTNSKIKIGYFSSDFRKHAVLQLIFEVFIYHNKSKFDIYAFSFSPFKNDSWANKVKKNFTEFLHL